MGQVCPQLDDVLLHLLKRLLGRIALQFPGPGLSGGFRWFLDEFFDELFDELFVKRFMSCLPHFL